MTPLLWKRLKVAAVGSVLIRWKIFATAQCLTNILFLAVIQKALQIVAYYDELEVVNPLGAYVKKLKVGVVFFLGNVHPKLCSRLRAINLVLVC